MDGGVFKMYSSFLGVSFQAYFLFRRFFRKGFL